MSGWMYVNARDAKLYKEYMRDRTMGEIINADSIGMICEMFGHDPERIGQHILTLNRCFQARREMDEEKGKGKEMA